MKENTMKDTTAAKILSFEDNYQFGMAYLDSVHLNAWEKEKQMTNPQGTGFAYAGNILNEHQRKRLGIHSPMVRIRVETDCACGKGGK